MKLHFSGSTCRRSDNTRVASPVKQTTGHPNQTTRSSEENQLVCLHEGEAVGSTSLATKAPVRGKARQESRIDSLPQPGEALSCQRAGSVVGDVAARLFQHPLPVPFPPAAVQSRPRAETTPFRHGRHRAHSSGARPHDQATSCLGVWVVMPSADIRRRDSDLDPRFPHTTKTPSLEREPPPARQSAPTPGTQRAPF